MRRVLDLIDACIEGEEKIKERKLTKKELKKIIMPIASGFIHSSKSLEIYIKNMFNLQE